MGDATILSDEQRCALERLNELAIVYPLGSASGVGLAGLRDLAVMKLAAISRRGLRRDFWDLYEAFRTGLTLRACGEAYVQRFGIREADLYHMLRALKDPILPSGMNEDLWSSIKAFFRAEAPKLVSSS